MFAEVNREGAFLDGVRCGGKCTTRGYWVVILSLSLGKRGFWRLETCFVKRIRGGALEKGA